LCKKEENEVFEKIFPFDKGTVLIYKPTGDETEISGVKLNGILRIAKEIIEINGEDHVYMIMKTIFEDKSYTISKDKKINERKK
jgi:hypothetical protein